MSDNRFNLQINLTKAYVGDDGGHYLEGIASGPEVDLTGERMSVEALHSMVSSIQKRLIEFRDAHKDEWNDDLGEVVALHLDENNRLHYKAKLDLRLSKAQDLWYLMTEKGKKYGVSIGGSVIKAGMEYVAELGRQVYTYFDVDLYEISVTRQAAYQNSFANAVLKSLPKGHTMSDETQTVEKTEEVASEEVVETPEAQENTQEDVAAEEQSDATPDQPQIENEVEQSDDEEAAVEDTDAESEEAAETQSDPIEEEATNPEPTDAEAPTQAEDKAEEEAEPQEEAPEVAKALTQAEAETEELRKSLDQVVAEVEELKKSLSDKTTEAEATQEELAEVRKSLEEKELELMKQQTRKAVVFTKFHTQEGESQKDDDVTQAATVKFAGFIANGTRQ